MSLILEQSILNNCLTVIGATEEVMAVLKKPDVFSSPDYQKVYAAICELSHKAIETDVIAVNNLLLEKHGNRIGFDKTGVDWLDILLEITTSADSTTGSLTHYCFLLIQEAMRTSLQRTLAASLTELSRPGADVLEVIDHASKRFEQHHARLLELKSEPFSKALNRVAAEADEAGKRGDVITGIRTGLVQLDEFLKGLHPATLTILAGRPSVGKTAQSCQMAYNIAYKQQIPVAFFTLEMSSDQLARRFLALDTCYKNAHMLSGMANAQPLDMGKVYDAVNRLGASPLHVREDVHDLDGLRVEIKRMVRKLGVKVVFIDYLQLIETPAINRREMTGKVSRGLKLLSKDLKIPIVTLAQISREVDKREDKRPVKSDLKESGDLEQDADNIIFQYRESYYASADQLVAEDELENIIAKNRNGTTHKQGESIKFWLDLPTNRVADSRPHSFL